FAGSTGPGRNRREVEESRALGRTSPPEHETARERTRGRPGAVEKPLVGRRRERRADAVDVRDGAVAACADDHVEELDTDVIGERRGAGRRERDVVDLDRAARSDGDGPAGLGRVDTRGRMESV